MVLLGPYAGTIGGLTNKNTGKAMFGDPDVNRQGLRPGVVQVLPSAGRLAPLAAWFSESGGSVTWWAMESLVKETCYALNYAVAALAVGGVLVAPSATRRPVALAVLAALAALHTLILWRVGQLGGYISTRHTLTYVIVGCILAGPALVRIAVWCAQALPGRAWGVGGWSAVLVSGLILVGAIPLRKALHANRAGHKAAGLWLARHVVATDAILDPFCWAEFYAGRVSTVTTDVPPPRVFVILETSDNQHSRLPLMPVAKLLAPRGELVYHWPEDRPSERAAVVVYAVPRDRLPRRDEVTPPLHYRVGLPATRASGSSAPAARGGLD
jgi:hypothetical protein